MVGWYIPKNNSSTSLSPGDRMSNFTTEDKNRVKRRPDRGHYDTATVYGIIDETMLCHIGFIQDGQPFVIPALHARKDNQLLVHGASTSRLLTHIQEGNEVSVNITMVDGIVLAKTVFSIHKLSFGCCIWQRQADRRGR